MIAVIVAVVLLALVLVAPGPRPLSSRWPLVVVVGDQAEELEGFLRETYGTFSGTVVVDRSQSEEIPRILERLAHRQPNLAVVRHTGPLPSWNASPVAVIARLDTGLGVESVLRALGR